MDVRLEVPASKDASNVFGHNLSRTVCTYRKGVWYNENFMVLPLCVWPFLRDQANKQGLVLERKVVTIREEEPEEPKAKEPKEKKAKGPKVVKKLQGFNPFLVGE